MGQIEEEIQALLDAFGDAVRARDLEATLALLAETDVIVVGSEAGEESVGLDEVRAFFARLYARESSYGWEWSRRWVSLAGRIGWFVADGEEVIRSPAGEVMKRLPYVMSGVAERRADGWRLRMLHGSEPA